MFRYVLGWFGRVAIRYVVEPAYDELDVSTFTNTPHNVFDRIFSRRVREFVFLICLYPASILLSCLSTGSFGTYSSWRCAILAYDTSVARSTETSSRNSSCSIVSKRCDTLIILSGFSIGVSGPSVCGTLQSPVTLSQSSLVVADRCRQIISGRRQWHIANFPLVLFHLAILRLFTTFHIVVTWD